MNIRFALLPLLAQAALVAVPVNSPAVPDNPPAAEVREDLEGRIYDYLMRHGDNGKIDPELLLKRTREIHEQLEHDIQAFRKIHAESIPGNNWVSLGPTNGAGRILSVATDPTVSGTAIIGSAGGGAWKTTDFGKNWTALTETIPNLAVGAVAIAPSSPSVVYLGTGEAGPNGDRIPGIGVLASND